MAKTIVAICYDFDSTLSTHEMQYWLAPRLDMTISEFWANQSRMKGVEFVLSYLWLTIEECKKKGITVTRDFLQSCGADIEFYNGVKAWFKRINEYALSKDIILEHYIISTGNKEMIEGTPIYKEFKKLDEDVQDKLLPSKFSGKKHYFGSSFSTVEDFQKFIDDNKIASPIVFRKSYPKIYDRLCRRLLKEEKPKLKYRNRKRSYSDIRSTKDLQLFIDSNEVHSRKELHKHYSGLYVKFSGQLDEIVFKNNGMSLGENFLCKLFNDSNIKYTTQKFFYRVRKNT